MGYNNNLKVKVAGLVGSVLKKMYPDSAKFMKHWAHSASLPKAINIIFQVILFGYLREYYSKYTSTERREEIKSFCMGGEGGAEWARHYDATAIENRPYRILYDSMKQFIPSKKSEINSCTCVGCSSGRDIAWVAETFPDIQCFGSDIDAAIIKQCRNRWGHISNLQFKVASLANDNELNDAIGSDLLLCSGVVQYVDEDVLNNIFAQFSSLGGKFLILFEPIQKGFDIRSKLGSRPPSNFSWSHPYVTYLQAQNFELMKVAIEDGYTPKTASLTQNVFIIAQKK